MVSSDPNTLKGYDMVISLSEDAINKQFRMLYDTKIPSAIIPDSEEIKEHVALPAAEHYINHNIKIQPCTWEDWDHPDNADSEERPAERPADGTFVETSGTWLEGEIDAPYVTFGKEGAEAKDLRCVRVHLKFKKGKIVYYVKTKAKETSLDGCTFSWLADLTIAQVPNFKKDLVDATRTPSNSTLMSPEVLEKFAEIDPQNFSVTALFCRFTNTRCISTFEFTDKGGIDQKGQQKAVEAANLVASYFRTLSEKAQAGASPNNPFVLGYGLTQRVEKLSALEKAMAQNAPYLLPKEFDLTVTNGDPKYTKGTLNFCILTNRATGEPINLVDRVKDPLAGIYEAGDTMFKRIRANGMSDGADGVMVFSRGIFRDYFLREKVLEYFKLDLAKLGSSLVPKDDRVAQPQFRKKETSNFTIPQNGNNKQLMVRQTFEYDPMPCQEMDTEEMKRTENIGPLLDIVLSAFKKANMELKYNQRRLASGWAEASLTYASTAQNNPFIETNTDDNRKITFDITLKSFLTVTQQASGICNINQLFRDKLRVASWLLPHKFFYDLVKDEAYFIDTFSQWQSARQADVDIVARAGFDMTAAGKTWKLKPAESRTTIPNGSKSMKLTTVGPATYDTLENIMAENKESLPERNGDGVIIQLSNHEMFKQYGTALGMEHFAAAGKQWASDLEKQIEANMAKLADSLMTKLILPAGNVFEFKTLNADDHGHVYSLINYKTPTELSQQKPA